MQHSIELVPGMRIDLFTGTEVSERAVHATLAVCVPYAKCSQGDNLVFFDMGKEFGCILGFNIDLVVSGR